MTSARVHAGFALPYVLAGFAVCACTAPSFVDVDAQDSLSSAQEDAASEAGDPEGAEPAEPERTDLDGSAGCAAESCASDARPVQAADASTASASDAGANDADSSLSPDAAPISNVGLDTARSKWVGRYATRSFVFAHDKSTALDTHSSYVTVAEIKPTADGGLTLEEQLCRFKAVIDDPFWGKAVHEIKYPDGTGLRAPLMYDAERFHAFAGAAKIGYGGAPADCAGKATSTSSVPVRPWLVGNVCNCPTDLSAMPADPRDCRVFDHDQDNSPGATYEGTWEGSWGVQKTIYRVAQEVRLRLVNAYRTGGGLFAQREYADVTSIFSCVTDGRPKSVWECPLGVVGACAAEFQPVELVPITAQQGCEAVLQQEQTLFAGVQPPFPAACRR